MKEKKMMQLKKKETEQREALAKQTATKHNYYCAKSKRRTHKALTD